MTKLLSQGIGNISNPWKTIGGPADFQNSTDGKGLVIIFTILLKTGIILAGVYALFNFLIAGYSFMSAGGDSKAVGKAWEKIWQSMMGLLVAAGCLILGGITSYLIFGDATFIVSPRLFRPN